MTDEILGSVLLGAFIGAMYVIAAYFSFRFAHGRSQKIFLMVALGGIGVRLFVAVALIALVFALSPVNQPAFLGGFFAVFVLGLILEVTFLHRSQLAATRESGRFAASDTESFRQ